jgi:hypothetical protein
MNQPKQPLTVTDVDAVGRDPDPQAAFLVLDRAAQRVLGHKLLTVMRHVTATAEVERIYSSNPRAYPVGGRKQKQARRGASRCQCREPEVRMTFAALRLRTSGSKAALES